MKCCKILDTQRKPMSEVEVRPKYIFLSVIALLCLLGVYVEVVLFCLSRYWDIKWTAVIRSNDYFDGVQTLFRSAQLREYFQWMVLVKEIENSWELSPLEKASNQSLAEGRDHAGYLDLVDHKRRLERKLNVERAHKPQEIIFLLSSFTVLFLAHVAFVVPFFYKLLVLFRSRLLKMSIAYCVLGMISAIAGVVEIQSVFQTNSVYGEYENLALNGSKPALLLASCGIFENEFTKQVKEQGLMSMREDFHVCQNEGLKLTAGMIAIGIGVIYLLIAITLLMDFRNAMENKIVPKPEQDFLEDVKLQEEMIAADDLAEDEAEVKRGGMTEKERNQARLAARANFLTGFQLEKLSDPSDTNAKKTI